MREQFPDGFEKLVHDNEYADGVRKIPERGSFQVVNHLNKVGLSLVLFVLIVLAGRPESASLCRVDSPYDLRVA